ncbi:hypothetical protein NDU88_001343 [Pleurodeles waltl]|uniref:Uncharacterized protein n=1 Tax=Pleurodeles waltl TaxID=8319 RepID=A0AAV7Q6T7_PLEWA|nr:hypothetical protein NDU88_001343 [Pleurodeles waltl]
MELLIRLKAPTSWLISTAVSEWSLLLAYMELLIRLKAPTSWLISTAVSEWSLLLAYMELLIRLKAPTSWLISTAVSEWSLLLAYMDCLSLLGLLCRPHPDGTMMRAGVKPPPTAAHAAFVTLTVPLETPPIYSRAGRPHPSSRCELHPQSHRPQPL